MTSAGPYAWCVTHQEWHGPRGRGVAPGGSDCPGRPDERSVQADMKQQHMTQDI